MKKTKVTQQILPLAFLVVAAAMTTACEKGGPRTAPDALIKARCSSEKAYNSKRENQQLAEFLSRNGSVEADKAIRTYITKFEVGTETALQAVPTVINPNNASIASVSKSDDSFATSNSADAIMIQTDCADLTASARGPGFHLIGMTLKKMDINSLELEKKETIEVEGKPVYQETTLSLEKSAVLIAEDKELADLLDNKAAFEKSKELKRMKHMKKAELKRAKSVQASRGNILTKVTIKVTSSLPSGEKRNEEYVIEQRSGEVYGESKIKFDKSVLKMIKDRTSVVGTPNFVEVALAALAEKDEQGRPKGLSSDQERLFNAAKSQAQVTSEMKIDPVTGGRAASGKEEDLAKKFSGVSEAEVINELVEKLNEASGFAPGLPGSNIPTVQQAIKPEPTPAI